MPRAAVRIRNRGFACGHAPVKIADCGVGGIGPGLDVGQRLVGAVQALTDRGETAIGVVQSPGGGMGGAFDGVEAFGVFAQTGFGGRHAGCRLGQTLLRACHGRVVFFDACVHSGDASAHGVAVPAQRVEIALGAIATSFDVLQATIGVGERAGGVGRAAFDGVEPLALGRRDGPARIELALHVGKGVFGASGAPAQVADRGIAGLALLPHDIDLARCRVQLFNDLGDGLLGCVATLGEVGNVALCAIGALRQGIDVGLGGVESRIRRFGLTAGIRDGLFGGIGARFESCHRAVSGIALATKRFDVAGIRIDTGRHVSDRSVGLAGLLGQAFKGIVLRIQTGDRVGAGAFHRVQPL